LFPARCFGEVIFSPNGRKGMPKLFIVEGPGKGKSFDLMEDTTFIGRGRDNDIQIKERSVSRRHAKIIKREDSYYIEDLNSKNGTFISGMEIHPGKVFTLKEGVPVFMGNVVVSIGVLPSDEKTADVKPIDVSNELTNGELEVLDSLDIAKEIQDSEQEIPSASQEMVQENSETFVQDRPFTPQKNVELIYNVSNVLMQSLHLGDSINGILETILSYILDLLKRLDRGAFILLDTETGEITQLIPMLKKSAGDSIEVYSKTIVNRVIKERKPVVMLDTNKEDEADLSKSMKLMNIRSVMCVPLFSRSTIRGVIYVDSIRKPYGFRREDLSLLTALSIPAAYAIENATMPSADGTQRA
jgi:3',5'-cyclic-nucleotide phosphodiesterase